MANAQVGIPSAGAAVAGDGYPITTIHTRDDYLQHDQNWDVLQGRNGLIYVGNGNGLMEWDGEQWRTYHSPNRTRLRGIVQWKDGRIYTGTPNDIGYYETTASGGLAFASLIGDWPEEDRNFGEVWSIAANADWVVFVTVDQLFVWDGQAVQAVAEFAPGTYRALTVDERIVIKRPESSELVELVFSDGQFQLETISNQLPADAFPMQVYSLDSAGRWLVVTAVHGVLEVSAESAKTVVPPEAFGAGVVLFSSYIDGDGYHYLGTLKHGLFVVAPNGQLVRNFTNEQGLGTNTILSIAPDDQGNLWLAGAPVVTRMIPTHLLSRYMTEDNSQQLTFVTEHQGKTFLGGFGFYQKVHSANPLSPDEFKLIEGTINNQVWDAEGVGDELLLATNDGVVSVRFNEDTEIVEQRVIAESAFAYDIDQVPGQPIYYAATHDGLQRLVRSADGRWTAQKVEGVDRVIRHTEVENENTIWAAAEDNKLFRVSDVDRENGEATVERFDGLDGIGDSNVFLVKIDGRMYFGSPRGLLTFDPDATPKFQLADRYADLLGDTEAALSLFLPDAMGRIWYQTDEGRFLAEPAADGGWTIRNEFFAALPDRSLQTVYETAEDQTWLILEEAGLHAVNLRALQDFPINASLRIRSVLDLASDAAYYQGHGPVHIEQLTQQNNSIRIQFALSDFRSDGSTVYRTRLLGSSADSWSDWSQESRKDYTLLGGGDYRFQVEAKSRAGRTFGPAELAFSVAPHWYWSRTAVFLYALCGILLLALAVLAGSKWRKRKTVAKQRELQALVAERTAALAAANQRLHKLANSDGLTGLANRRQFDDFLRNCVASSSEVALVLADVDHFKRYNDAHGHLAGDDLLKSLAKLLIDLDVPENGLVARYGGEEFALVLPHLSMEEAVEMAAELRQRVEQELGVTISVGVARDVLRSEAAISRLIEVADRALYAAKQAGRNQVISRAS